LTWYSLSVQDMHVGRTPPNEIPAVGVRYGSPSRQTTVCKTSPSTGGKTGGDDMSV
jgi:hypothetical protein